MKHIEKVVFLICLLVVAGLSAWVFFGETESLSTGDVIPPVSGDFNPTEYEGLPVIPDAEWSAPTAQDSEGKWLYRVFTPPILYLVDGRFTVERPPDEVEDEPEEEAVPFGVRLVEMIRKQYRLQLDAVYEMELDNIDSAVLSFENVYATQTESPTISLKKGETHPEHDFRVDDIRKERRLIGGGLETEHIATITDLENGKVYLLSDLETFFEEGVTFLFESTENTDETARIANVGDTFVMNEATYTLAEISLDPVSLQVVKEADFLDVPETETLSISQGGSPETSPVSSPRVQAPPEDESSVFDEMFN